MFQLMRSILNQEGSEITILKSDLKDLLFQMQELTVQNQRRKENFDCMSDSWEEVTDSMQLRINDLIQDREYMKEDLRDYVKLYGELPLDDIEYLQQKDLKG